ncbi:MAG TPA: hypothetical protein PLK28_10850 [Candidatus Rifleibacterium sp.]|nr:hypothetical protein [Candidatus Rifleibacterium sp.]
MPAKLRSIILSAMLACHIAAAAQTLPENPGRKIFPSPADPDSPLLVNEISAVTGIASDSPAFKFIETGDKMVVESRYSEAKEAYRTALRLEPMNLSLWAAYDDTVIAEYIARKRREKQNPVIERDLEPLFSIDRIDSYIELGTLYVAGSLSNLSKTVKRKIQLTARILDENKRELRSETGTLRSFDKGLLPKESSLFEIPFKDPPAGARSFRVEITAWE